MKTKKANPKHKFRQRHPRAVLSFAPNSPWQTDDREWFARHPRRDYRLRRTYEGEWPVESPYMLVRRARDGVRIKRGLLSVGTIAAADVTLLFGTSALIDSALAMLWTVAEMGEPAAVDELLAQVRGLRSTAPQ